jgi:hypothetical protein
MPNTSRWEGNRAARRVALRWMISPLTDDPGFKGIVKTVEVRVEK